MGYDTRLRKYLQETMNMKCLPIHHANKYYSTSSCCGASPRYASYEEDGENRRITVCKDCNETAVFYCTVCFGQLEIDF